MKNTFMGCAVILPLVLLGLSGCQREPEGWTPVLEETSTAFLETEMGRLLDHVRTARGALETNPTEVERSLSEAEASLEHLTDYYIPIFQARERAYNAYRSLYLQDDVRVMDELGKIEEVLDSMAEEAQGARLAELQSLAELVASARLAVEASTGDGAAALETLARNLNLAALKGDLVLRH